MIQEIHSDHTPPPAPTATYTTSIPMVNSSSADKPSAATATGEGEGEVAVVAGKTVRPAAAGSAGGSGRKSSSSKTSPSESSSSMSTSLPSSSSSSSSVGSDNGNNNNDDEEEEDAMMSSSDDDKSEGGDDDGDDKKLAGRDASNNDDNTKAVQSTNSNFELFSTSAAAAKVDRAVDDGTMYGDKDVLSGRGGATNLHAGNRYYRDLILSHRRMYDAASKSRKPEVARIIVEKIRARGGRFLRRGSDNVYHEINDTAARAKTRQALRHRMFEYRNMKEGPDRPKSQGGSKVAKKGKGGTGTSKSARGGGSTRAGNKASKAALTTTKTRSKTEPTPLPRVDYEQFSPFRAGGDNPLSLGNPALYHMAALRQQQQQMQLQQGDSFLQQAILKQREIDALEMNLRTTPLGASSASVPLASLQHQHHQAMINLEKAMKDVRDVEVQRGIAVVAAFNQVAPSSITNPTATLTSQHPLQPPPTALAGNALDRGNAGLVSNHIPLLSNPQQPHPSTGLTVPLLGSSAGMVPTSSIMGTSGHGIPPPSTPIFPLGLSSLAAGTTPRAPSAPTATTPLSFEAMQESFRKREQERHILELQHIQGQQHQSSKSKSSTNKDDDIVI